ncbi:MAG: hypothetical protein WCG29_10315 [Desulfomonile sp.]
MTLNTSAGTIPEMALTVVLLPAPLDPRSAAIFFSNVERDSLQSVDPAVANMKAVYLKHQRSQTLDQLFPR